MNKTKATTQSQSARPARAAPEPGIPFADRETVEQTIATSRAHLDMLRSKSGDAAVHVAKGEKAITDSYQALADADNGQPRPNKRREAPEPGSPITNLQKAAKRAKDEGDSEAALQAEGARLKVLLKADTAQKTFGRIPKDKGATRLLGNDQLPQAGKFAKAARDLGADQDGEAFKGVLRKLAKPKS